MFPSTSSAFRFPLPATGVEGILSVVVEEARKGSGDEIAGEAGGLEGDDFFWVGSVASSRSISEIPRQIRIR